MSTDSRNRPALGRLAAAVLLLAACGPLAAVEGDTAARWREDLEFARARIHEVHPAPARKLPAAELDARFAALESRLGELEPYEVVVELASIVAALGDGHTRLTLPLPEEAGFVEGHSSTEAPTDPSLVLHTLPLRLGIYAEGVFVERIEERHAALAGARVVSIGGMPINEAIDAVAPVVRHDNRMQLLDLLPMHLVIPEILAARGLSPSRAASRFGLELPGGERREVELRATPDESAVRWRSALDGAPRDALSLREVAPGLAPRRGAFARENWIEKVPEARALYFQYNRVEDEEPGSIAALAARLRAELAGGAVDRVVVDLRWNWGGDNSFNLPLLHALIAGDASRDPGGLVVLIGRGTFSAAMMCAVSLERHLHPLFVGEPTGSSPNHSGDSRKFRLPQSNLTLRISTLDWQLSDPRDDRDAIGVEIAAPPSWNDLLRGRDRALEIALAPERADLRAGEVAGAWRGAASIPYESLGVELDVAPHGGAELRIYTIPEPIVLAPAEAGPGRIVFAGDSPFGPLRLEAVGRGERLVGRLVRSSQPWYPMPLAFERVVSSP